MSPSLKLRIAILTDIHAFSGNGGQQPSWINLAEDQSSPKVNPFAGLYDCINSDSTMRADIVVCGGDMGDKASPEGQQYVWQEMQKLRTALEASQVVGTAGNHDMDSRFVTSKFDAKGQLQSLEPPFPLSDRRKWLEYWAQNYTLFEFSGARFVLLNSAAYHGYHDGKADPEYFYGRVSDRTLDVLVNDLKAAGKAAANILICHHHPLRNDQIKLDDYSEMKNGDRLINALIEAKTGPWLVIHGHKHLPRVIYAPGGNVAPTIFSAGSFSARLYPEYGDKARNEFYILELEVPGAIGAVSSLRGTIATWQWSYGYGWQRSRAGHGLGPAAAFGARVDVAEEAFKLASELKAASAGTSVTWEGICSTRPMLKYLIPEDLSSFMDHLQTDHGLNPLHNSIGEVCEIQVPTNG